MRTPGGFILTALFPHIEKKQKKVTMLYLYAHLYIYMTLYMSDDSHMNVPLFAFFSDNIHIFLEKGFHYYFGEIKTLSQF